MIYTLLTIKKCDFLIKNNNVIFFTNVGAFLFPERIIFFDFRG